MEPWLGLFPCCRRRALAAARCVTCLGWHDVTLLIVGSTRRVRLISLTDPIGPIAPYHGGMTLAFDALDAPLSPLARRDPRWKLTALVPAIFVVSALRLPFVVAIAFMASVTLLIAAQLPRRKVFNRLGAFG